MRNFMMSGATRAYAPDDGGGTGTGEGTGTGTGEGAKPWYDGADAELVGHIQTKGWHDLEPGKAALAAIQAHREAEKYIGAPADRLIKLPASAEDEAGWADVFKRLGAPEKPEGYDFSDIKVNDEPVDPALVQFFRDQAVKLHLPAAAAPALLADYLKHQDGIGAAAAAEKTAKLAEEHKTLEANWGKNMEANKFIARKGAEKLGLDAAAVDALEGVVGYAKTMEALRKVGEISGEAKFIGGSGQTQDGIMTREQATARKAELMADQAWVKRYMDGGAPEGREMTALLTLIVGDDTADSASR